MTEQCLKCNKPAKIKQTERLPDNGILYQAVHDDGSVCKWPQYEDLADADLGKKRKHNPQKVTCPKCGKSGRAGYRRRVGGEGNQYDDSYRTDINYYVDHGDNTKHNIVKPAQRENLLKQLGRYISTIKTKTS